MNRFRSIFLYLVLILVSLGLLAGIRGVERSLDDQVAEHRLRFTGEIRNAPPMVIFTTVAIGSFRGLVADLLWLRASALQEKRNFFEMVQLARWIVDLQPNFAGAIRYLAWNMAYNISVTCSNFADRWRWVNEGIRLLRDQALLYNPEDTELYTELAWIYHHKIGNIMDDANLYYKNRIALEVMNIVGTRPDWPALAAAPADEEEFRTVYGPDHPLWVALNRAGYADYTAFYRGVMSSIPPTLPPAVVAELRGDRELEQQLTNYFRALRLREILKLDPREVVKINQKYGELDWRIPDSFAIYWATRGMAVAKDGMHIECDRIITQALHSSFRFGRLLMIDEKNFESVQIVPNLALVDAVYETFSEKQIVYDGADSLYSSFRGARINFMKEAVTILYNYGHFKKAEEYFQKLVKEDGPQKEGNLENFVMEQWAEGVRDAEVRKASEVISGLIFRGINYLVYNDPDAAVASERIARYVYRSYASYRGTEKRVQLPPYNEMKRAVVERCLNTFPPELAAILKARIAAEQAESREAVADPAAETAAPAAPNRK